MQQPTATLKGVVERITYTNPDNGYTIARFKADGRFDQITVVGALANVHPGARLKLEGRWKTHPKYGEQFELLRYIEAAATLAFDEHAGVRHVAVHAP